MKNCVDEGGNYSGLEKRHIQDELDSNDSSPPKLMTTPRRSRDKTIERGTTVSGTSSDRLSSDEISVRITRSSIRTSVKKSITNKTRSSNLSQVEQRRSCKTKSSNSKLLENSVKKSRSSSKTLAEKSTSRKRSPYCSPVLGKKVCKTRLFNQIPLEDTNTSKTELPNISLVEEKSASKRSFSRIPIQEEIATTIKNSNIVSKIKTHSRTPLQERSANNLMSSDKPLVTCTSGTETRSADKTPLNGRIVKASSDQHSISVNAKDIESYDQELKMKLELKERKKSQIAQEQNIKQKHQSDTYLTNTKKKNSGNTEPSLQEECVTGSSDDSEVDSSVAVHSLSLDIDDDIQKEVEKVKKRRSTIGRGHIPSHSFGGRQSLCASFSLLTLEDQLSKIDEGLPWTTKMSCLVDVSIREALRRIEACLTGNEFVIDLRVDLLTKYENLCGKIAYKYAENPKNLETVLLNTSQLVEDKASSTKIAAYKKKTKELEHEYKNWKIFMKERKLACKAAEREFHEAKSGEKKIEDQTSQLTLMQRNMISSRPNYHHYIQETQMVHEKAVLMFQEVRLVTNALSSLITDYTVIAESSYSAVDELCFGHLKNQSAKTNLASLLQRSHTVNTDVPEP